MLLQQGWGSPSTQRRQEPHGRPEAGWEEPRVILRHFPCSSKTALLINLIVLHPRGEKLRGVNFSIMTTICRLIYKFCYLVLVRSLIKSVYSCKNLG